MGGHERPCNLVPRLGTRGYGFHDRFSHSHGLWWVRVDPGTKGSRFCGLFDVMTMIGTKLVHVCEGTVRYPVEWVQGL